MRPVFCGNFEYDTRQSELERLFSKYGRVERIDMKSGILLLFNLLGSLFLFINSSLVSTFVRSFAIHYSEVLDR